MLGERAADDVGQRNGSESGLALRRPELRDAVLRADELAVDSYLAVEEVDPVDAQTEAFPLPETCPGGEDDESRYCSGHASASACT